MLLIYRTRMLWPVMVAHGLYNYFVVAASGRFTVDVEVTPLNVAVACAPWIVLLAGSLLAVVYRLSQAMESVDRVGTRTKRSVRCCSGTTG
ncbi:MAG: hypothetical protein CK429_34845 [Mycobacterium sp.]|nr:MAG: hypothetical protein CK429_34845 [Mycobacterium sp.]PJE21447.1 MAG: hypothetical protein CK431_21735 [Mycobacterium sp.]